MDMSERYVSELIFVSFFADARLQPAQTAIMKQRPHHTVVRFDTILSNEYSVTSFYDLVPFQTTYIQK